VYCELRLKIGDGTAGNVTLKVAGTEVFNVDTDTRNGGSLGEIDNIRILSNNALHRLAFDDVYVCDTEGTINNTFLGPIQVLTLSPTGDDTTDFTATGAGTTHADRVADANADDDTTYVESSTTDDQDIWDYEDIDTGFTISGIEIDTDVRETDASDFTLATVVKSGATTDVDTAQPIAGTDWEILRRVVEVDPNTSEQWTAGNFNAAKFGVEVG